MNTVHAGVSLTPTEAIARELIDERTVAHHHVARAPHPHRVARVLRRLAERLDPGGHAAPTPAPAQGGSTPRRPLSAVPHAGSPRPWAPASRSASRHT